MRPGRRIAELASHQAGDEDVFPVSSEMRGRDLAATTREALDRYRYYVIATDQDRASIRSHLDKPQANADGSYNLYFGPKAPAGKEAMWIKTIPGQGW